MLTTQLRTPAGKLPRTPKAAREITRVAVPVRMPLSPAALMAKKDSPPITTTAVACQKESPKATARAPLIT